METLRTIEEATRLLKTIVGEKFRETSLLGLVCLGPYNTYIFFSRSAHSSSCKRRIPIAILLRHLRYDNGSEIEE